MRMTNGEPKESPSLEQATALCRDQLGPPTADELDRGLDAFLARIPPTRSRARSPLRWSLVGAAAVLCALVLWQVAPVLRVRAPAGEPPMLTYRVDGGSVLEGGYLRESGHTGLNVTFNEGSRFTLTPGTRGRIRLVNRDTAQIAIERGKGSFQIVHKNNRSWRVEVGPFLVTVTGTSFSVSWDPASEEFSLRLKEGHVMVSGPVSAGAIPLRAGQRLVANLAKVETVITEESSEQPAGASTGPADVSPASSGLQPAVVAAPPSVAKPTNDRRWSRKLARGEWDRILDEANRSGIEATLRDASSEDLFALANAARYRHHLDLARSALLSERRRFPSSARTLEAIYLLGRVEESQDTGIARAIAWYDEYLARAPRGPLAGEALGRKMTLTERVGGPSRARSLADEYLRRFPKGNYAGSARELLAP